MGGNNGVSKKFSSIKTSSNNARDSGLSMVGAVAWGTHFCQFYQTQKDLTDILVPYFKAGLMNNECCVWVTSDFLTREEALKALEKNVPNFSRYLKKGQIEIFPYTDWYIENGKFDLERVLNMWLAKHAHALKSGFDGLRVSGNPFWIDNKKDWDDFSAYEAEINNVIDPYNLLVLCTYSLTKCHANEVIDVVTNHKFALIKRSNKWELIESTEQKKAKEALKRSEAKYQSLFENMINGFAYHEVIFDKKGKPTDYRFLEMNDAFEKLTGLKKEHVLGKTVREVIPGIENDPAEWIEKYGKVALTGKAIRFENYAEALDRWYSVYAYSHKKGYFAVVFEDITVRKKLEEKQKNFFTIVSHELGNLITPIHLSASFLERRIVVDTAHKKALKMIKHQTKNMSLLIHELSDLSRLERGKIKLDKKKTDLTTILKNAADAVRPMLDEVDQKLVVNYPKNEVSFTADPQRIEQVLANLLTNASKYSDKYKIITLSAKQKDGKIFIKVRDHGVGISDNSLPHIFDLFEREEFYDSKKEGLGVGLYLSRELIRLHDGEISVKSGGRGKGSEFTVKIPL